MEAPKSGIKCMESPFFANTALLHHRSRREKDGAIGYLETTQEQDRVDQCLCELGALTQEEDSEHFHPRVLQKLYAQYAAGAIGTVESHQDASQCGMTEHFPCFGLAEGSLVLMFLEPEATMPVHR